MKSELDRILDAGLGSYSDVEPRMGLERRVMSRIATKERRRWLPFAWAAVVAVAALVVAAIGLQPAPEPPPPFPVEAKIAPAQLKFAPQMAAVVARRPPPKSRAAEPPKEDVFPAASPLSPEERALVAWAGKAPGLFAKPGADLIEIEEIKIQPLNGSH